MLSWFGLIVAAKVCFDCLIHCALFLPKAASCCYFRLFMNFATIAVETSRVLRSVRREKAKFRGWGTEKNIFLSTRETRRNFFTRSEFAALRKSRSSTHTWISRYRCVRPKLRANAICACVRPWIDGPIPKLALCRPVEKIVVILLFFSPVISPLYFATRATFHLRNRNNLMRGHLLIFRPAIIWTAAKFE